MVVCLERGADLHTAQLMPLPLTVSCFSETQIGFTFLVPAHLGGPGPGQRAVKRVCVCVCVFEGVVQSRDNTHVIGSISSRRDVTRVINPAAGRPPLARSRDDACLASEPCTRRSLPQRAGGTGDGGRAPEFRAWASCARG